MKPRALSLVGRITVASAIAAALGGAGAAVSAGIAARALADQEETAELRRATRALAHELVGELEEEDLEDDLREGDGSLASMLADEVDDLKIEEAHASLWLEGRFAAGERELALLGTGECVKRPAGGHDMRVCTMPVGRTGRVTLAVTTRAEEARNLSLVRALFLGTLGGALFGGMLSYLLARWAVAPLNALRDRVRRVKAEEPRIEPIAEVVGQPEIEELRSAIVGLVDRLAAALAHAQAFAAEAAHELRTPLTTIAGELELMAEEGEPPSAPALLRVLAQVQELTSLVQRLLVLAQPAPLGPDDGEVIDLSDVAASVEQSLEPVARARVHWLCEEDVIVCGDGTLLRSLLSNALDNALKFSTGQVEVTIVGRAAEACIDVIDAGPGVTQDERERVFAPFYRSPSVRASPAKGHGLGLALIASVARRHRGVAEFIASSRGARLQVRLPRRMAGGTCPTRVSALRPDADRSHLLL